MNSDLVIKQTLIGRGPLVLLRPIFISILTLFLSCSTNVENRNRAIGVKYFEEVWNKGNIQVLDTILTADYKNHTPSVPTIDGPAGLKPIVLAIRKAFPDLKFEIKEVIATEGFVTIRTVMTGIQSDTLFGQPPTNKKIAVNQINIEKIRDGKIAEHWRVTDELTMLRQLGLVK